MVKSNLTEEDIERITAKTIEATFTRLGIDISDPMETQRDFQHLRDWRVSIKAVKRKGVLAAVSFLTVATLGAMFMGVKTQISG